MNEIEIFRPITGYEGLYEISNCGKVKSLYKERVMPINKGTFKYKKSFRIYPEREMKQGIDKSGYFRVRLSRIGIKKKTLLVSRLVALAFIKNPENLPCTNHKDNNRKNNNVNNLEWVTNQENKNWSVLCGRQAKGEQINTNKLTEKEVLEILNYKYVDGRKRKIKDTYSQVELAKKYRVTQANIRAILTKKTWKHLQ